MKLAEEIQLSEVIKWERDPKTQIGNFVIASEAGLTPSDVDQLLQHYGSGTGNDLKAEHAALAAALVEPILQAVPYKRWTNLFYSPLTYEALEDNRIPVEFYTTTAWQTGPDSQVNVVRPGFAWTRPDFSEYSTGIEMPWSVVEKSGWNILARMMQRASEEIARKIDIQAQAALDVAIDATAGLGSVVSGGLMTKAGVDAIIKAAQALGFPMVRAAINSGTVTDMSSWSGGPFYNAALPPDATRQILQTLYLGTYGGVEWFASPFVPTNFVYFGGPAEGIGYEQIRGAGKTASDVDIRKRFDFHIIISPEEAFYVGNSLNLRRLRIAA